MTTLEDVKAALTACDEATRALSDVGDKFCADHAPVKIGDHYTVVHDIGYRGKVLMVERIMLAYHRGFREGVGPHFWIRVRGPMILKNGSIAKSRKIISDAIPVFEEVKE